MNSDDIKNEDSTHGPKTIRSRRRDFLSSLAGLAGISVIAGSIAGRSAQAQHTDTHFEDSSAHQLVYQCNKADHDYLDHVLFSCGEMLRKYGDDIELVIAAFGPGLNLLLRDPRRPITEDQRQRVASLAEYGVRLHACGNTMKSMKIGESALIDRAIVVPIGVDDIMQLQEKGYSYISM